MEKNPVQSSWLQGHQPTCSIDLGILTLLFRKRSWSTVGLLLNIAMPCTTVSYNYIK